MKSEMFNYSTQLNLIDLLAPNQSGPQAIWLNRVGHFLRQVLTAVFLALTCAVPVMAASIQLPAIVEPASQEHHIGKLVLVELVTPDLAASKKFYGGLFGWTFRDIRADGIEYAQALLDAFICLLKQHRSIMSLFASFLNIYQIRLIFYAV